jgi:hypothetical protein
LDKYVAKNPPYDQSVKDAFYREYENNGGIASRAAKVAGVGERQGRRWAARLNADPSIVAAADAGGIEDISTLSHLWKIAKDEDGNGYSLFIKNPQAGEDVSFSDMVKESIQEAIGDKPPKYEKRKKDSSGNLLLVIDLADVHFLKLCVKTETGYEYNRSVARHRVIEGTKALLRMAKPMGVCKILFVLGNDILHVDNSKNTTTSGTHQDVEGSIFEGYKDAQRALVDAIELCAKLADVDLLHCMSNHDWKIGWALSQSVGALLTSHPNVKATDYNLSEKHTKYYRFETNLFGLSHGDGAKEEKLYGMMVQEAREHISECKNLYWLLHHVHHKIRNSRNGEKPFLREKDHNGMTAIVTGQPLIEGHDIQIEYVRSPSPPDGWHHRNGYINRQGVECFLYDPYDGLKARFTEWF